MSVNQKSTHISIIGCGVMGSGLAKALSQYHQITVCDRHSEKAEALAKKLEVKFSHDIADAVGGANIIILCVKPQDLKEVSKQLFGKIRDDQVLVSILSGVTQKILKLHFGDATILRIMPNIACFYGEGVMGFVENKEINKTEKKELEEIFKPLGYIHWVEESQIDALTALAGSGPAFAFVIIESMVDAAVALGLSSSQGRKIATQMFQGALKTLNETGKHPGELKWEVTSPAGCTIAGIKNMEDHGIRSGLINTFLATYDQLKGRDA